MPANLPRRLRRAADLWKEIDEGEFADLRKLLIEAADSLAHERRETNRLRHLLDNTGKPTTNGSGIK